MSAHPEPRTFDRLLILGAAVLFSTGGAAVKLCELSTWQIASFRSGIAAFVLIALMPAARRGWTWRTWMVGLAYAATMISYVVGNKLTTAANTIFLQGTAPLYILILGPFLLGERFRRRDLIVMLALVVGLLLIFVGNQGAESTAPNPPIGNLVAAVAGLTWALTLMGLRWLGRHGQDNGAPAAVAVGNLIACAVALPFALPAAAGSTTDWGAVAYLGVIQIAVAYIFLTHGMRRYHRYPIDGVYNLVA